MSQVFFISDLHIGHKRILEFSPMRSGTTIDEHDEWLVTQWNSAVRPKDRVWVLGDVCFNIEKLNYLARMHGRKTLIRGNHDGFHAMEYLKYFDEVLGLHKQYGFWLSHAPIHVAQLRDRPNIHGHMHHHKLDDPRYINVSVEQINGVPISLDKIREIK